MGLVQVGVDNLIYENFESMKYVLCVTSLQYSFQAITSSSVHPSERTSASAAACDSFPRALKPVSALGLAVRTLTAP